MHYPYCNNEAKLTDTPIIFTHNGLRHSQDPFVPEPLASPIYLAPRYFIKVHGPNNDASAPITYRIPHSGKYKGMIRLMLKPSLSLSTNSSYRVEYWEWNKILYPKGYNDNNVRPGRVTSKDLPSNTRKLLFTEYWNIPEVREQVTIPMRRVDSSPDFPFCDYINRDDIVSINKLIDEEGIEWFDYELKNLSYHPPIEALTNDEVTHTSAIAWGQSHPRPTTRYKITFTKSVGHEDILYLPEQDRRARDTYSTRHIKSDPLKPFINYLFPPFM